MSGLEGALESRDAKVDVPQRKLYIEALEQTLLKQGLGTKEQLEAKSALNAILDEYIEENLANTRMFESRSGTAFPYAKFDTAEFAKRLYAKYTGLEPSAVPDERDEKTIKKTFVFSVGLSTAAGSTFLPWEEHVQNLAMKLPAALEALKNGKEPEHTEIYAVGLPINVVGKLSDSFMEEIRAGGTYDALGKINAEFVASQISEGSEKGKTELYLHGMSVGASVASKAAEILLASGQATQIPRTEAQKILADAKTSTEERTKMETSLRLPHVAVRVDMPVGINEYARARDIPMGLPMQTLQTLADPYSRAWIRQEGAMGEKIARELQRRHGIEKHMDPEQEARKHSMLPDFIRMQYGHLVEGLRKGTPVRPDVRVTRVFGSKDPYAPSTERNKRIEATDAKSHSLGQRIIPSPSPNMRTFGAKGMRHEYPKLRDTDVRQLARAASALAGLKAGR